MKTLPRFFFVCLFFFLGGGEGCRMSGVPSGRECSGTSRGSSAHAGISEMGNSGVRPCRENGNYLKWVAN